MFSLRPLRLCGEHVYEDSTAETQRAQRIAVERASWAWINPVAGHALMTKPPKLRSLSLATQ
jgi:hypothetical protein